MKRILQSASAAAIALAVVCYPVRAQFYPMIPASAPETISATATTGAYTATLAAGTGNQTTYICGVTIDAMATSGTIAAVTITGLITGTLNLEMTVSTLAGVGTPHNSWYFNPCIPASAPLTAIVVHTGAAGSGGVSETSAWGYNF